ncbi:MAG: pentapeptide repeat-containing protein [Anaerolineae bacterium]|nr:pentapeptide repeat-containing protein [Anaerolineae bacterium]
MSNADWINAGRDLLQAIISGIVVASVIFWLNERRAKRERRLSDYRIASNWNTTEPKVSLRNFDLTKANLSGCEFIGANLERAIIRETSMWATDFTEANLREVNFRKSEIYAAKFRKATAFSADFSWAIVSERGKEGEKKRPNFTHAVLKSAKFIGTQLIGTMMVEANLQESDFTKAIVQGCDFTGADFHDSNWKRVKRVENCVWKNVKVDNSENFPPYLWKEIQSQNAND